MPYVSCMLDKCIYCDAEDCVCTFEGEIVLYDEHSCVGGCDEGWVFPPEDEEE